eukprot:3498626-Ditylum_brightwellii.AAC.1
MENRFVHAEVELLLTNGSTCQYMANKSSRFSNRADIKVCLTYSKAISGRIADNWQLVPSNKKQSLTTASGSRDDGTKKFKTFKLLSPCIKGNEEYTALFKQVDGTTAAHDIKFSQSACLHICIGAQGPTSDDIEVLFATNFFEATSWLRHDNIAVCTNLERLIKLMNSEEDIML